MAKNIVKEKSFEFSLSLIKSYKNLIDEHREFVLSKQMLRSGTSIGAMIREFEHAESKADFIHKLSIALKEANETEYWIELLFHSNYIKELEFSSLKNQIDELIRLLVSIVKTSKQNIGK